MRRREFITLLGGAATWPLATQAGQAAPVIGLLAATKTDVSVVDAVRTGLGDEGFVEGRNLTVIYRSAEGQFDRLPELAGDLVKSKVSVIFATGSPVPARVAKAVTMTIPIVFAYGGDPVSDGLVASLNRPGGNVTGATFMASSLVAKRLELLTQIAPKVSDVALLVNPKGTLAEIQIKDAKAAAQTLGLQLHIINASSPSGIDEAFAEIGQSHVDALLVSTDPYLGFVGRDQIAALAIRYRIPAIYSGRFDVDGGGLISYGGNLVDTWRQAGVYVGRILKGENPSDLPVVLPTRFELVINLKAAKQIGLTIAPSLLGRADEVIE
jgi:putative tryptophan/tyrosine transport system substrate-binding protein